MCEATVHFIHPRQTLHYPATSKQLSNSSSITSSASMSFPNLLDQYDSISGSLAPFSSLDSVDWGFNYKDIESGTCVLADSFCSFKYDNGTIKSATPENLDNMCLLWDNTCSGNRTLAIGHFFSNNNASDWISINGNLCFRQDDAVNLRDCETYNPPSRLSEFQKLKDWMRSSQCASARWENDFLPGNALYLNNLDYNNINLSYLLSVSRSYSYFNTSALLDWYKCCADCNFEAGNVDLYYWPEPDADTSCLSIITQATKPSDYGATIDPGDPPLTYWGCTGLTTGGSETDGKVVPTTFETHTMVAEITSMGSLLSKIYWYSPWSSGPCIRDDEVSQNANTSVWVDDRSASIHARNHALSLSYPLTKKNDSSISSIVLDGFTL